MTHQGLKVGLMSMINAHLRTPVEPNAEGPNDDLGEF